MPRLSILLAALLALAALAGCGQPREPLPTPVPRTPVPLSPDAISPENARRVKALQSLDKGVAKALAFSPDGSLLVIAGGNRLIVYDAHSLAELRLIDPQVRKDSPPYITSLAFSPDGTTLAAGFEDGYVRLFEPRQGALLQKLGPHVGTVIAVAFSADGQTLASAGWDSRLRVWQVTDGTLLGTFTGPEPLKRRTVRPECSMPAAFSPDGALIAWACNRNLGLYRVQDGVRLRHLSMPEKVQALAFSPDGAMLAASSDKRTRIWRMDAAGGLSARDLRFGGPRSLSFSPDGQLLAGGSSGTAILVRVVDGGKSGGFVGPHRELVYAIGLSPDGTLLATGSEDGIHCFWGVEP